MQGCQVIFENGQWVVSNGNETYAEHISKIARPDGAQAAIDELNTDKETKASKSQNVQLQVQSRRSTGLRRL